MPCIHSTIQPMTDDTPRPGIPRHLEAHQFKRLGKVLGYKSLQEEVLKRYERNKEDEEEVLKRYERNKEDEEEVLKRYERNKDDEEEVLKRYERNKEDEEEEHFILIFI
ncbi:16186_t:CDS:2 [Funneliformis geosporum]|uniref:16186_t:CDS:1 n=1 Tax=Funneliformis geosporum TaxID=1117311 RepID=A0A9W4SJ23_9GLOM|nr:16186_t:CDS:2 [Funneliformis geosporum]